MIDQIKKRSARESILTRLQRARGSVNSIARPISAEHATPTNVLRRGNIDRFKENLIGNEIRIDHIEHPAQAIPLIADFLRHHRLNAEVRTCVPLSSLDWQSAHIIAKTGSTKGDDLVCVSQAYAGIEDTGTLVLLSSLDNPTLLNFLPDHHIVFLSQQRVLSAKADLWNLLKQEQQPMPRAINLISGPSRTADIEQTIQLGAHGPRSLWLFLTTTP